MSPERIIKTEAKERIKGNMPALAGGVITIFAAAMSVFYLAYTLAYFVIYLSLTNFSILSARYALLFVGLLFTFLIAGFILISPLILGLTRLSYLIATEGHSDYSQIFYYIHRQRYFDSISFMFRLFVRKIGQALICFLPAMLMFAEAETSLAFYSIICYYVTYALIFGGLLLFSFTTDGSFLAPYYYIEGVDCSAKQMFASSVFSMARCRKSKFRLYLSLLPMMLSCILIIPCIFVIPYITLTKAVSAKWILRLSYKEEV